MYKFVFKHVKSESIKIGNTSYANTIIDETKEIQYAPKGAEELTIAFSRSDMFYGIFRKFTIKARWYGDGYDFIKKHYDLEGLHFKILVDFYMYKKSTLAYELNTQNGVLNNESIQFGADNGRPYVEIEFEDSSFEQLLMSRMENKVDYSSDKTIDGLSIAKQHVDYLNVFVENVFNNTYSTNIQMAYPLDIIDRVVELITNENERIKSDYLGLKKRGYPYNGEGSLRMVTKGRLCRGYTTDEANLTTTFKDFFASYGALFGLGAGIERKNGVSYLSIEPLRYYFQDDVMFTIDVLTDLVIMPNKELIFNKISCGFENYETQNSDIGQTEYNTKAEYAVPTRGFEKELKVLSKYRGDGTSINRLQILGSTGEQNKKDDLDDSIFIVDSVEKNDGTLKAATVDPFDNIGGIYSTALSYNNAVMSPARVLYNNSELITPSLEKLSSDKKIVYQSNESLSKLYSKKKGENTTITEKTDFQKNDLKPAFLSPLMCKFSAPLTPEMISELTNNPYRKVRINDYINKIYLLGWVKEATTKPIDNSTNWVVWIASSNSQKEKIYLQFMNGENIQLQNNELMEVSNS